MNSKKPNMAETARDIARPIAESMGLVLWDTVFVKEGPSWVLRFTVDRPGGVFIEDCEKLSRAVDPLIEELDLTEREYCLEVTSPGLGRTLRTDGHLAAYLGKPVRIKLYKALDGDKREFFGNLAAFDADAVTLKTEQDETVFRRKEISGIKADDDRDLFGGKTK
jgi:ribosome maturation factor RimP